MWYYQASSFPSGSPGRDQETREPLPDLPPCLSAAMWASEQLVASRGRSPVCSLDLIKAPGLAHALGIHHLHTQSKLHNPYIGVLVKR